MGVGGRKKGGGFSAARPSWCGEAPEGWPPCADCSRIVLLATTSRWGGREQRTMGLLAPSPPGFARCRKAGRSAPKTLVPLLLSRDDLGVRVPPLLLPRRSSSPTSSPLPRRSWGSSPPTSSPLPRQSINKRTKGDNKLPIFSSPETILGPDLFSSPETILGFESRLFSSRDDLGVRALPLLLSRDDLGVRVLRLHQNFHALDGRHNRLGGRAGRAPDEQVGGKLLQLALLGGFVGHDCGVVEGVFKEDSFSSWEEKLNTFMGLQKFL